MLRLIASMSESRCFAPAFDRRAAKMIPPLADRMSWNSPERFPEAIFFRF